jgi:hypothetical protein
VFGPELARLGWAERPGDDPQTLKLRGALIELLHDSTTHRRSRGPEAFRR